MYSSLRIVVTGLIAQYPLGGVAWDYMQYVVGLARLGHDVYYVEDTGQWPYNPKEGGVSKAGDFNAKYLNELMARFQLGTRWAYRFPWKDTWYGMDSHKVSEIVDSSDLVINLSGVLQTPGRYRGRGLLIYIDSDPVFTQVKLARGQADFRKYVDAHDVHFSFGERLGSATLRNVPESGHHWLPTRQPILLDEWFPQTETPIERDVFTTVMNWTSYKPLTYKGQTYGQKDVEFTRIIDLPQRVSSASTLEIAINDGKTRRTPRELLVHKGWRVVDPMIVCPDLDSYRKYIQTSKAEFSVAKQGYVVGEAGWFSCRSACYLAAGRPVVVQDTGFQATLPVGKGLIPFRTIAEAVAAIEQIEANYHDHALAARGIAEVHFDSDVVLNSLISRAFAG